MPAWARPATPAAFTSIVILVGVLTIVDVVSGWRGAEPAGLLDQGLGSVGRARVKHEQAVAAALANDADLSGHGVGEQDLLGRDGARHLRGYGRRVRGVAGGHRGGRRSDHAQAR